MSWLPVPARRLTLTLGIMVALAAPSAITLWVSTPSADDIQQRVANATKAYGVVLLTEDEVPPLLDHFILGCADLDHGIAYVEQRTGVRAAICARELEGDYSFRSGDSSASS